MRTYLKTSWGSQWEIIDKCLKYFGDIQPFFHQNGDIAVKTCDRLITLFNDADFNKLLKLEMAIVVDLGFTLSSQRTT